MPALHLGHLAERPGGGMARQRTFWLILAIGLGGCGGSGGDDVAEAPGGDDTAIASACDSYAAPVHFVAVDTGQSRCYGQGGALIECPASGADDYGQDAQYAGVQPSFTLCGEDAVVVDRNTGLMWQRAHNARANYATAWAACDALELGGYGDWRLPSIKELFSIADFSGTQDAAGATRPSNPFIFDDYFHIEYAMDAELTGTHTYQMMGQTWSATARPDNGNMNYFFNFLDGHLKSQFNNNPDSVLFYRCVRGASGAFENTFTNNNDGTVSDGATGLMWQAANGAVDADYRFTWREALAYCEGITLAGHADWRLPNIRELQGLVDYTDAASAIDTSVFGLTLEPGTGPFFWSGTTDEQAPQFADYVCFGPCWNYTMTADIHGPGAQRSDPKYDNGHLPRSLGDQEDLVQAENYVRCVRTQ